jgi:hypothetical protein
VLSYALRLDLLDRAALSDLRSFALVERAAGLALFKLERHDLRLRVRVHKLFGFKDPMRTHVSTLFPKFSQDPWCAQAPKFRALDLPSLARKLCSCADAPAWVTWAEQRPRRVSDRKRKIESDLDAKSQRRRLVEAELARRDLPFDERNPAVIAFCAGRSSLKPVVEAMQRARHEARVLRHAEAEDARDAATCSTPAERLRQISQVPGFQEPSDRLHVNMFNDFLDGTLPQSAARVAARLWLWRSLPPGICARVEAGLALQVALRAGELMLNDNDRLPAEAWATAARGLLARIRNAPA